LKIDNWHKFVLRVMPTGMLVTAMLRSYECLHGEHWWLMAVATLNRAGEESRADSVNGE
jgi:hypothetical protein